MEDMQALNTIVTCLSIITCHPRLDGSHDSTMRVKKTGCGDHRHTRNPNASSTERVYTLGNRHVEYGGECPLIVIGANIPFILCRTHSIEDTVIMRSGSEIDLNYQPRSFKWTWLRLSAEQSENSDGCSTGINQVMQCRFNNQ